MLRHHPASRFLKACITTYADGAPTSAQAISADVTHFLMWAAEPKLETRKRIGVAAVFFLSIFLIMSYLAKRRVWADVH